MDMQSTTKDEPVTRRLADFRRGWQKAVPGQSLLEVKGSVGWILVDVCDLLQLDQDQRSQVLGAKLAQEVKQL